MAYNGWKNYETWNVALWIENDECLYEFAKDAQTYANFRFMMGDLGGLISVQTPDGVPWNDSGLDIDALDNMIAEL